MTNPVNPSPITALPPAPLVTDNQAQFDAKAFPFTEALSVLRDDVNLTALQTYQNSVAAKENADTSVAQASTATSQAGIATAQAGIATTQAGIATDAAEDASESAVQASKLNLGAKSTPPTLDNQGNPLLTGATYYDTTLQKWRSWNGTAWVDPVNVTAGVESISGQSGVLTLQQIGAVEESTILARMQATSLYF